MTAESPIVTAGYRALLRIALVLILAAGMGMTGCEPVDVQCGDIVDVDHGRYRLNGDVVCPWAGAVTITGEGVHFDLNDYSITPGPITGHLLGWGISVTGAKAHIYDGSIVGMDCAFFDDAGCGAILLNEDAHGAWVTSNDLSDTGGYTLPDGTPDGGWGYVGCVDDVRLIGNTAQQLRPSGIQLFGGFGQQFPERNRVLYNTVLDSGRAGILLVGETEADRPRDNLIQRNTAVSSVWDGRDLGEVVAGAGPPADWLNTWKDNDFEVADPADCIE